MNREIIKSYKKYYFEEMKKYQWNYCTAFQLTYEELYPSSRSIKRVLTINQARAFLHNSILSYIKRKILFLNNNHLKRGIPFYAYYIICKEKKDIHYHLHMILNIPQEFEELLKNFFELFTGGNLLKLETKEDVIKMIIYMLKKGNFVMNSDDERLLPTPYNLKVNKKHFSITNQEKGLLTVT